MPDHVAVVISYEMLQNFITHKLITFSFYLYFTKQIGFFGNIIVHKVFTFTSEHHYHVAKQMSSWHTINRGTLLLTSLAALTCPSLLLNYCTVPGQK